MNEIRRLLVHAEQPSLMLIYHSRNEWQQAIPVFNVLLYLLRELNFDSLLSFPNILTLPRFRIY
jgi:hypothetical protein